MRTSSTASGFGRDLEALGAQLIGHALEAAGVGGEHHAAAPRGPLAHVRGEARGVALDERRRADRRGPGRAARRRADRHVDAIAHRALVGHVQQRDLRRSPATSRPRCRPARAPRPRARPGARDALGLDDDAPGVAHQVEQGARARHEERHPALHAVEEVAVGEAVEDRAPQGAPSARTSARSRASSRRACHSRAGATRARSRSPSERWLAMSKVVSRSTSSPKKSRRTGCSPCAGQTSTIPPRTANSARCSTRLSRR